MKGEGIVIIGSQFGDEGKGKIVDVLSEKVDYVVRYQGGNNAGHTVKVGQELYKLHLLPSGVVRGKHSLIGAGVVVDPKVLYAEITALQERGFKLTPEIFSIDFRANVIMPWHNLLDAIKEGKRSNKIGTTGRGIGPAYEDKAARTGIRFEEFCDKTDFKEKLRDSIDKKNKLIKHFDDQTQFDEQKIFAEYEPIIDALRPFEADVSSIINEALDDGKKVLFEGAQGTFLDQNFGTYPYVTSSHPIAGGACVGVGVGPSRITSVQAIVKAYTTRVGEGPFPTELTDSIGDKLCEKGHEFGTTTGRKRRVGWLDIPLLRRSKELNGFDGIHLTKLDVLGGFEKILACTHYELNGEKIFKLPTSIKQVARLKPVYQEFSGFEEFSVDEWQEVVAKSESSGLKALPKNAFDYVDSIRKSLDTNIYSVSVGPGRKETLMLVE